MNDGPDFSELRDLAQIFSEAVTKLEGSSWVPRSDLDAARRKIEDLMRHIEGQREYIAHLKTLCVPRDLIFDKDGIHWLLMNIDPHMAAEIESRMPKN